MKSSFLGFLNKVPPVLLALSMLAREAPVWGQTDTALENCLSSPKASQSAGMNECVVRASEQWSERMERAYQRLRAKLDPTSRKLLEASQKAWEIYRTKEQSFMHGPWRQHQGTFEQLNISELRLEELRNRARTLESYLPNP